MALLILAAMPHAALEVVPWTVNNRRNVVLQESDLSCGAAAIAMVLQSLYGSEIGEKQVLEAMGSPGLGATVQQLVDGIDKLGYRGRAAPMKYGDLAQLVIPVVLFMKPPLSKLRFGHFVALLKVTSDGVVYRDPTYGNRVLAPSEFRRYWETRTDAEAPGIVIAALPRTDSQRDAAQRFTPPTFSASEPMALPR